MIGGDVGQGADCGLLAAFRREAPVSLVRANLASVPGVATPPCTAKDVMTETRDPRPASARTFGNAALQPTLDLLDRHLPVRGLKIRNYSVLSVV